jgi:hypothetical protein
LVRGVYLFVHPPAAENAYWTLADGLLRNGSLSIDGVKTTLYEPLYPMFLAAARIALGRIVWVDLLQVAVTSFGMVLVHRLAFRLTRDGRVALVAAALYAIDPLLVRQAATRTESALFTTLLIAFASAFVDAATWAGAAMAGAWLGLAVLTRTTAVPLILLAPGVLVASRRVAHAVALFIAAVLVVLPLPLRNQAVNGAWWPTRSGVNLYIGNSPRTDVLLPYEDLDLLQVDADRVLHERRPDIDTLPASSAERVADVVLTDEALRFMTARPLHTVTQKIVNVGYVFSPRIVPYRQDGRARSLGDVVVFALYSTIVMLCAIVGVYVRRRSLREDAILWCIATTVVVVTVIYVPATRYRAPMEFVLAFYAAAAWSHSR